MTVITVDLGDGVIREADESTLEKRTGVVDNDHEHTEWVEYYSGSLLVHRSVHVHLKHGLGVEAKTGVIG